MRSKSKPAKRERKSFGEKWAAKVRAQCNKLTRAQREHLRETAMQLAYGQNWRAIAKANDEKLAAELRAEATRVSKAERKRMHESLVKLFYGAGNARGRRLMSRKDSH